MAGSKKRSSTGAEQLTPTSPWLRVSQEVYQGWELRKEQIKKIEQQLDGKVIVYFTSFQSEAAMIHDTDAEMLENILSAEHKGGKLLLVLSSPGGVGLAAERIVNVCRAYSNNQFEVIVPHMAKSAATMICFGASRIHMSPTSELGPVDPQVKYSNKEVSDRMPISAEEYVRSYDQLMDRATSGDVQHLEPLLQQLARYDARYIEQLKSWQALSESISIKLLKSGMMKGHSSKEIKDRISAFLIQRKTRSHGRMITMHEAKKCGLDIAEINLRSELWNTIWELYIRADWVVSFRCAKILESATTSLSVPRMPDESDG
jgi:ATP-dependent protease ClpP protease subunit